MHRKKQDPLEKGTKNYEMYINEQKHTNCIIRI